MEKSQYTVKKINSTEHDNFVQEDILGIHHFTKDSNKAVTKVLY